VKEYTVGVEAFGRPADYDPKIDPIVRVQARRLRAKLDEYYATEGATDTVRITLPKGGYVPVFEARPTVAKPNPPRRRGTLALVIGAIMVITGIIGVATRDSAGADAQSIAVLPLRNIADDQSRQFVADKATEALITSLAQMNSLRVASGTTTRRVSGMHDSLPEMAKALKVRWIVEGAVGQERGRLLIKMRVVDATSDRKIWADALTCTQDELSATQQKAAGAIEAAIEHVLTQPPRSTHEYPRPSRR
jgi:TolB-like protein